MRLGIVLAAAVLGTAATAFAKDTPQSVADDAKLLERSGEHLKAAERFGDAVALAHAANDLQAEQAVADSLEEWFDGLPAVAAKPDEGKGATSAATPDPAARGALLAAVMRKLDPNRCGGFVSAPCLAREVLLCATETGEFAGVADAAKVASAHARRPASGRAAPVVAKYAEGLKAVADGHADQALAPLESAIADSIANGWLDVAVHATTELAAAWMAQNAPDSAAAAVTATVEQLKGQADAAFLSEWLQQLRARLPKAPESVTKPLADLVAKLANGAGAPGKSGGAGGRGGSGGATDIGKLLPKWPKTKPFVSATRTAKEFSVHWTTKPDEKQVASFDADVHYVDEGGVWLGFYVHSVALSMVDVVGGRGGLGGRPAPTRVRAFYLLAEGETWGVTKDGVVSISH